MPPERNRASAPAWAPYAAGMRTRTVGPIRVGAIGFGCMPLNWAYRGGSPDDPLAVVHRAIELGMTLLDTADVYGPHANEELVGRAIAGRRDEVVLATKAGLTLHPGRAYDYRPDGRPEQLRAALEGSLRRLGTDRIDLHQLHRVDPEVPLAESWGAMAEAVAAGRVAAIGLSEVSVEQLDVAHAIHPVASVQSELSLWTRDRLADVVPWCAEHGAAFIPYSPLGRGFLAGTITTPPAEGDFRGTLPRFTAAAVEANQAYAAAIRGVAERIGATPAQVALAWCLAQGEHVVPIPGTKRERYLEENVGAGSVELDDDARATLDALPPASTPRY